MSNHCIWTIPNRTFTADGIDISIIMKLFACTAKKSLSAYWRWAPFLFVFLLFRLLSFPRQWLLCSVRLFSKQSNTVYGFSVRQVSLSVCEQMFIQLVTPVLNAAGEYEHHFVVVCRSRWAYLFCTVWFSVVVALNFYYLS